MTETLTTIPAARVLATDGEPAFVEHATLMKRRTLTVSPNGAPASRAIRFELAAPEASQVFIAGSFNDWRTTDLPMVPLGEGKWAKDLALVPGRYEYLFVVDDTWVPDPAARETVPNPFWGVNAVVVVPGEAK